MTLITCPNCGRRISDRARECPGCKRTNLANLNPLAATEVPESAPLSTTATVPIEPPQLPKHIESIKAIRQLATFIVVGAVWYLGERYGVDLRPARLRVVDGIRQYFDPKVKTPDKTTFPPTQLPKHDHLQPLPRPLMPGPPKLIREPRATKTVPRE